MAKKIARAGADAFLSDLANKVLNESQELVPKASRALLGSGAVQHVDHVYFIYYDTPYAVRQHEDATLRHPDPTNPLSVPGTQANYLGEPLLEARKEWDKVKKWF
jgi:hypothetical protein